MASLLIQVQEALAELQVKKPFKQDYYRGQWDALSNVLEELMSVPESEKSRGLSFRWLDKEVWIRKPNRSPSGSVLIGGGSQKVITVETMLQQKIGEEWVDIPRVRELLERTSGDGCRDE